MYTRLLCTAAAIALTAWPVAAQPAAAKAGPAKPTLIVYGQPASKLLADWKSLIRLAVGPKEGEKVVKEFQKDLQDFLGEKGFEGIDIDQQLAAYITVTEKVEDSTIVLVMPITTDKEFLGLLERIKLKTAPVADKPGLYTLELPPHLFPHPSHVRFFEGMAYVGLNGEAVNDPAALVPAAELFNTGETTQIAVKLWPERFPEKLLGEWLDQMDNQANRIKGFAANGPRKHENDAAKAWFEEAPKLVRRCSEGLRKDGKEAMLRVALEPATGAGWSEVIVTPRPDSPLAKYTAARTATTNRFSGLVPADAVVGIYAQAPLFSAEPRVLAAAMLEMARVEAAAKEAGLPEAFKPIVDELFLGLMRTAKTGDADLAAALVGPDKDGTFGVVGAVSFDDTAPLEKALRGIDDAILKKLMKFDADKVGDISIHTFPIGAAAEAANAGLVKMFGKSPVLAIALAPKAIYVSFGADPIPAIKAAIGAKPAPMPALSLMVNPNRLHKLIAATGGDMAAKVFAESMGIDDKLMELGSVAIEGGKTLKIKVSANMKYILGFFMVSTSRVEKFEPVEPGVGK